MRAHGVAAQFVLDQGFIVSLDDFIDNLVEHAGENDPLEGLLQEVLVDAYKGRLLHFASDLSEALRKFAGECTDLITCNRIREYATQWANLQLKEKSVHPEPDEEETSLVF